MSFSETRLVGRSGGVVPLSKITAAETPRGTYEMFATTTLADDYEIRVVVDNEAVPRYPLLRVVAGAPDGFQSTADIVALAGASAGDRVYVEVQPRDAYGNAVLTKDASVEAEFLVTSVESERLQVCVNFAHTNERMSKQPI